MKSLILAVSTSLCLLTGLAHAAPIVTFDFTGNASQGPLGNPLGLPTGNFGTNSVTVSQDGLSVVITGKDFDPDSASSANLDRSTPAGLGVVDPAGMARVGFDEAIEFDFSPTTVLGVNSIVLEVGGLGGSFDLYVDNVFAENVAWVVGGDTLVLHEFGSMPVGSVFEFRGNTASFRIAELTVEVVPIPEPNALILFGIGSAVVAVRVRR